MKGHTGDVVILMVFQISTLGNARFGKGRLVSDVFCEVFGKDVTLSGSF